MTLKALWDAAGVEGAMLDKLEAIGLPPGMPPR